MVNDLQRKFESQDVRVLCLYLNYMENNIQTLENLFGSLLKQLFQYQASVPGYSHAKELYQRAMGIAQPSLNEIHRVLSSEIMTYRRVYLVIDALDECPETTRHILESWLLDLRSDKCSLMIFSRPFQEGFPAIISCDVCGSLNLRVYFHCDICFGGNFDLCQSCFEDGVSCKDKSHSLYEPYGIVQLDIKTPDYDVRSYVDNELNKQLGLVSSGRNDELLCMTKLGRLCGQNPVLRDRILSVIAERADGMLLYARFYLEFLKKEHDIGRIKKAFESFRKLTRGVTRGHISESLGRYL